LNDTLGHTDNAASSYFRSLPNFSEAESDKRNIGLISHKVFIPFVFVYRQDRPADDLYIDQLVA
jgi:hypothetical protein